MFRQSRLRKLKTGCGRPRKSRFAAGRRPKFGCRRRIICCARTWIDFWQRMTSTGLRKPDVCHCSVEPTPTLVDGKLEVSRPSEYRLNINDWRAINSFDGADAQ